MSTILAFEASGEQCSVSLKINDEVNTLVSHEARAHAAHLLPFTEQVLAQSQLALADIDAIACAVGPGSFTGLRIALSVAQGLAYASDKPIIPINSLAAMTVPFHQVDKALLLPLVDARMDEVYWGGYTLNGYCALANDANIGSRSSFYENLKTTLEAAKIEPANVLAVGRAWGNIDFAQAAGKSLGLDFIVDELANESSSAYVADLAQVAWNEGHYLPPQKVDLYYCRDSIAWNKRKRIRAS